MTGAALIMSCSLLMGSGSAVLGAELAESDIFLEDAEEINPPEESETEQELDLAEVVDEIRTMETAETLEITEIPEITESPTATDIPPFTDSEEKDQTPSYKMWITPQQTQIKAGKELLYTISVENTGKCPLKNICLQSTFSDTSLEGTWEEAEDAEIQEKNLKLEKLETGIKKEFYFSVQLPETQSGKICLYLNGTAEYEEEETGELRSLVSVEQSSETEILPLKADFQVTKTADRTMAVPGDKVTFQICIRNTGERTLHSVVTTEKFQLQNVPVRFLEAEGIVLNKARTKARIEKIEGISGHADETGLLEWVGSFMEKPSQVFVVHGDDTVCDAFAETVKETYGINAMAPFSGSSYDLKEGCFVTVTKGIPIQKPAVNEATKKAAGVFARLLAACDRLRRVVMHNEGGANKDLARFADQINSLCDKWDR